MKEFDIKDYVESIVSIAVANGCGASDAVDLFIVNLRTMRSSYRGAESLNIRELGQAWNRLGYKKRNAQRESVIPLVAKKMVISSRARGDK